MSLKYPCVKDPVPFRWFRGSFPITGNVPLEIVMDPWSLSLQILPHHLINLFSFLIFNLLTNLYLYIICFWDRNFVNSLGISYEIHFVPFFSFLEEDIWFLCLFISFCLFFSWYSLGFGWRDCAMYWSVGWMYSEWVYMNQLVTSILQLVVSYILTSDSFL